mgnify:FL=1
MKGYVRAGDAVVIHRVQRGPRRQRRRRHCREAAEPIAANDLHGLVTLRLLACVMVRRANENYRFFMSFLWRADCSEDLITVHLGAST